MHWIWGIFAAVATTALSVGVFLFLTRGRKPLDRMSPAERARERQRSGKIAGEWGSMALHLVQGIAGLTAAAPSFALLIWIGSGFDPLPSLETFLTFAVMFVIGWSIFAWCVRVTDGLDDDVEMTLSE